MKEKIEQLKQELNNNPEKIMFEDIMGLIDTYYNFTEAAFKNGAQANAAGENSGSCKLLYFAQLNQLTEKQTLTCFGQYYREVLNEPDGQSHQNIREFMKNGWLKVQFDNKPLSLKS